jgi:hypothetical protein
MTDHSHEERKPEVARPGDGRHPARSPAMLALAFGVFVGAPLVWFASQQIGYGLSSFGCAVQRTRTPFVVTMVIAVALIALTAAAGWRGYRRASAEDRAEQEDRDAHGAARFFTYGGLVLAVQFVLVVIAQAVAAVMLTPCQ